MTDSPASPYRPGSVTFVVVLTWLLGIATALNGGLWLFSAGNEELLDSVGVTQADARTYGAIALGIGILMVLTAMGLGTGSPFARFLVMTVMILRIGAEVFALIAVEDYPVWQAAIGMVWAGFIMALLSTRAASDYFLRDRT